MSRKKWLEVLEDHSLSLQERMFRLLSGIAIAALSVLVVMGLCLSESLVYNIMLILSLALCILISGYAVRTGKIQLCANIQSFLIIFILIPVTFFTGGGIRSGAPLWFVFAFVYVSVVVYGRTRYVFIILASLMAVLEYVVSYLYPEFVTEHSDEVSYLSSLIAVLVVGSLFCLLFIFESKIYESENRLAQQQKKEIVELNEAQNRFFSSMSHEIRTPINTIIGLDEMILREEISEEAAADAQDIQNASKMLLALINDVLDMSKIESGKMEVVYAAYSVGEMLSDIVNMIWSRAKEKGLDFHVEVDPAMPSELMGDEVRLKQVMINLLTNAVKYTKEGSVTFSIQCRKLSASRVVVTYTIRDTGMGIRKENIPYLFSAFKRVDEEKNRFIEGTGLGLSIVKEFVDLMGGTITVDSVYTKGSTFAVELEQDVADENVLGDINFELRHTMNTREHYRQTFEAPDARILIVDDNEANLMVEEKLLRDTRVRIDTVLSGEEALKKTVQTQYHVILMDHLMPGMDGITCLHQIRAQTGGMNKKTPVVILTANAGSDNRAQYEREGFEGYLLKPVRGAELEAELVRRLPKEMVKLTSASEVVEEIQTAGSRSMKRRHVLITTDSVCDLPREIQEQGGIEVLPYRIRTDKGEFLDGIETETGGILAYMADGKRSVVSMAPEVRDYEVFFADCLLQARHIIHISMAKKESKGYFNALEAAKSFSNVTVVDSGHLSSGLGLLVMEARRLSEKDVPVEEIVSGIDEAAERIHTCFMVSDTEYLARSGRVSQFVDNLCRAFMLHPSIAMDKSRMKPGNFTFGTLERARSRFIRYIFADIDSMDKSCLFLIHSGMSLAELKEIEEQIRQRALFDRIIIQQAGPAISANSGPGAFGFAYMKRRAV
ncbi:MAG: DegV family EDD domain-containing protein [Lachnospiraceae bacterium]|nr:DegV family EDD domain-containing protein [Lachnospiraceae bacterium]